MGEKVITTQRTRKRYKLAKLVASLLAVCGGFALWGGMANEKPGIGALGLFALIFAGAIWLYAKAGSWWHNE